MRQGPQKVRRHPGGITSPDIGEHCGGSKGILSGLQRTNLNSRRDNGFGHAITLAALVNAVVGAVDRAAAFEIDIDCATEIS